MMAVAASAGAGAGLRRSPSFFFFFIIIIFVLLLSSRFVVVAGVSAGDGTDTSNPEKNILLRDKSTNRSNSRTSSTTANNRNRYDDDDDDDDEKHEGRKRSSPSEVGAGAAASSAAAAAGLSKLEGIFVDVPSSASARRNLKRIASKPHVAGTAGDWEMARFVMDEFLASAGGGGTVDATIFPLDAYLNYPLAKPVVQLLQQPAEDSSSSSSSSSRGGTATSTATAQREMKVVFDAPLSEDVLDFDATSDTVWRNHTFHGYSPSGDVTGEAVYVHFGRPEDFDAVETKAGVSIEGKVVIVRYGMCFRGLKVMNAQRRGAAAVLIYSDPNEDGGSGKNDDGDGVYPDGPWRPPSGVQRGSVQFLSLCAGDPMRVDGRYSARDSNGTATAALCGYNHTDLIPSIPSVPLSYGDARPLLQSLDGMRADEVFDDFAGGLDGVVYRVGPAANAVVRVAVNNQGVVGSIPNVVGKIPGTLPADRDMPVLLGNHRDAWVYGASDPNSGTAALLEVARGLGELLRTGWKPKRSIYLLSWSGEEYGLIGSTGWAELNQDKIRNAAAYLNVDTAVSGDLLSVAMTPTLSTLWEGVLNDLHDSGNSLPFGNSPFGEIVDANTNWIMNHPEHQLLGSGSDYTAFLDHFGIASMDFRFGRAKSYGQYHSIYDSFDWMDTYGGSDGKPGSAFDYMALMAKIWGLLALRLADADVLPLDHVAQGRALQHYADAIRKQNTDRLNLSALDKSIHHYSLASLKVQLLCTNDRAPRESCNEKLGLSERKFLGPGLPNRKWFKHVLQAPGMFLGYASQAFPGVQQAIDDGDLSTAQKQIDIAAERVESAAAFLDADTVSPKQ